jgi:hypothetical protein
MRRKIESFKLPIETFDSQCPNLDNIRNYVQQYLPEDSSWENIVKEVSYNSDSDKSKTDYKQCLSVDGWTPRCISGKINNRNILTPTQCKNRVDLNCEATDQCKWYYGFCENKNYQQQIEDPFSFRTRNWWQNRISGYPNIAYNDSRDGFIKIDSRKNTLKNDDKSNNSNIMFFYKKVFSDLMEVINNPYASDEERDNANLYMRELRKKMRQTKNMTKRVEKLDHKGNLFGTKELCNKNFTRNCFISDKYTSFIDNMGSIWYKERNGDFVMWDQVVGGANSTDSAGVCASKK